MISSKIGIRTGECGNTQEEFPACAQTDESSGTASQKWRLSRVRGAGWEGEMAVLSMCTGLEVRGSMALRELWVTHSGWSLVCEEGRVELRLEEWAGATSYQDVQTLFWKQSGATFKQGNDAVFAMHKNPWLEQGGWVGREQDWEWRHQHTGYTATCSSVTNKRSSSGRGRERMDLRDVRGRVHRIWWLSVYEGLCVSPYLSFLYSPNLNQGEKKEQNHLGAINI